MAHDPSKVIESGLFDAVLFKPVSKQALTDTLRQFLPVEDESTHQESTSNNKKPTPLEVLLSAPPATIPRLAELIEVLQQDFLPVWASLKDQWVLFKIEDFARQLKQVAATYQFDFLDAYAALMITQIDKLDLEGLKESMQAFPVIIDKIEQVGGRIS